MAHNPVGNCTSFASGTTSALSSAISHQSGSLRVVTLTKGAHIGVVTTTGTATPADYFIPADTSAVINIGKPKSQRIVGVSSGTNTTLTFPEGEGSQFTVGDTISFAAGSNSSYDFTEKIVVAVNSSDPLGGTFSQSIVVNNDSSSTYPDTSRDALGYDAYVRDTFRVAALALGTGVVYAQQVQVSGDS